MCEMRNYRRLQVWARSHALAVRINTVCSRPEMRNAPGLASQLRRAAASIPANIAEGCGFSSDVQLARHLEMSIGSAHEAEYHLEFGGCVGAIPPMLVQELLAELIEVRKMLYGLLRYLRRKAGSG